MSGHREETPDELASPSRQAQLVVRQLLEGKSIPNNWGRLMQRAVVLIKSVRDDTAWQLAGCPWDETEGSTRAYVREEVENSIALKVLDHFDRNPHRDKELVLPDGTVATGRLLGVRALNELPHYGYQTKAERGPRVQVELKEDIEALAEAGSPAGAWRPTTVPDVEVLLDHGLSSNSITALLYEEECRDPYTGERDWEALQKAFAVDTRKAVERRLERAKADLRKAGLAKQPAPPASSIEAFLDSHDVTTSGHPGPKGWVSVLCPWHDAKAWRRSAAFHAEWNLWICFYPECPTYHHDHALQVHQLAAIVAAVEAGEEPPEISRQSWWSGVPRYTNADSIEYQDEDWYSPPFSSRGTSYRPPGPR